MPMMTEDHMSYNSFDQSFLQDKWSTYNEAFASQDSVMRREIGCYLPVESHRILLKALILPQKTKSGIILSNITRNANVTYNIGYVIGIGPESYREIERFPTGPRCKIGDWVSFSPFEKQPERFNDYLCYILNDDRINFPIPDITKAVMEYRGYSLEEVQQIMLEEGANNE
jgi:co-chaperonin GroES (HSP10)